MGFKNFSMWRGRLPHWRADDVTYYVTFRHRRMLEPVERDWLLAALVKPEGRAWDLSIACVLPETTELLFKVREGKTGAPIELSEIVEPAKRRAGKRIIKKTGERFPPFFEESYDRIVRDSAEFEERWMAILESPVNSELAEEPENYSSLFVGGAP